MGVMEHLFHSGDCVAIFDHNLDSMIFYFKRWQAVIAGMQ